MKGSEISPFLTDTVVYEHLYKTNKALIPWYFLPLKFIFNLKFKTVLRMGFIC